MRPFFSVTGGRCVHHDKTHLAFVDALSAPSTAVAKWSWTKWGERLHLLATVPSFITSSRPHLLALGCSRTSILCWPIVFHWLQWIHLLISYLTKELMVYFGLPVLHLLLNVVILLHDARNQENALCQYVCCIWHVHSRALVKYLLYSDNNPS